MAKDKHIDPQLFRLFIEQKVYQRYADAFLPASQHDSVNEGALLAIVAPVKAAQEETAV
ncbi:hypothetical protein SAMN02745132_01387 [Enterovibrio nigricans DSM 22720]|uniref:Uncharacterized protein n=1 Tax=Enterovibrio nigricans DSM 22720 TaxID=1121868 RepID=A0A1T4UCF7_9GAMM|nr:hypothetical protein [Enterovibrio nigricans]SKA50363.1 hypothetical protein SAMN02745132_01387 [Enterovibrio nigricans DSM 22720]